MSSPTIDAAFDMLKRWGFLKTTYFYFVRIGEKYLGLDGSLCLIFTSPLPYEEEDQSDAPNPSRVLTSDEVLEYCNSEPALDMPLAVTVKAIERGDYCVGTFVDGRLVSYGWRAFSTTPHNSHIWVKIGPNACYNYKTFTLPEFRGRHISERRKYCGNELFRSRGIVDRQSSIASTNFSSLAGSTRDGNSKLLGYAGYFQLFGKLLFFRSPGVKKAGYEFYLPEDEKG
jgi:hypothetical protein